MPDPAIDRPVLRLVKRQNAWHPVSPFDQAMSDRHRNGDVVEVQFWSSPNTAAVRFYWALVNKVATATGRPVGALDWNLRIGAGHFKQVEDWDGVPKMTPASLTAFDGPGFEEFLQRVEHIVSTEILPGMTANQIIKMTRDDLVELRRIRA